MATREEVLAELRALRGEGPERPASFGESASKLGRGMAGVSPREGIESLGRGLADVPRYAGSMVGNFFRSLLPGETGREGAKEFTDQLGQVATAATGGLTGPLGMPRTGIGQLASGMDIRNPARAQAPTPQLALPPPQQSLGLPPPSAGVMPPHMNVQPPGLPSPLKQLPPPDTSYIPGQAPTRAGQGLIPGTPGATMRAPVEQPPVGSGQAPRMIRMPPPRPQQPQAAPAAQSAPTPPYPRDIFAGRQMQQPRPETETQPRPFIPDGAEKGEPSRLASALAGHDAATIDRSLARAYRRGVRPSIPGSRDYQGMQIQDQRITTAVDSIIDARHNLRLKDANGFDVPSGQLPQSLEQFSQAIDQLKKEVFQQYDAMAMQQGGQGVRVPLAPAIKKLEELTAAPEVRDIAPEVARDAMAQAQRLAQAGSYSPLEAQHVIEALNDQLKSLQKGGGTKEAYSHTTMMSQLLGTLRASVNDAMAAGLGDPRYQALRARYAALSSIEEDVARAAAKDAAKQPGGLPSALTNTAYWINAIHGVVTLDPTAILRAGAIKGAETIVRRMRNPNRAVSRLFANRLAEMQPSTTDRLSAQVGTAFAAMRPSGSPHVTAAGQ